MPFDDVERRGVAGFEDRHQRAAMPSWRTMLVCGV